ncbi:hypothetical protein FHS15_001386 [Paenibacillus castaneae]|uniref:hypothetical protein n=1 Tax=Paenibacillus castaneae TaxID=474957 RepID=UPI000C9CFA63|nr:hypothetical protein [Paenibacillus castaneae]NIK76279.1 hypothetical protein [Paenibacillus castaneae]
MNNARKSLRTKDDIRYTAHVLQEIEETIAELEVYLEANPEDEIAVAQYRQFRNKRKNIVFMMEDYSYKLSNSEIQA